MKYVPRRDVLNLISKIKPAAQILRDCIKNCESEDNVAEIFLQTLRQNDIDVQVLRNDLLQLLPAFQWQWFFTQIGLTQELSFFSETLRRVEEKFLPPLQRQTEVLWLVDQLFSGQRLDGIEQLSGAQWEGLFAVFIGENFYLSEDLQQQLHTSLEILAQRLSGLGLDVLIAKNLRDRPDLQKEFLELGRLSFTERDKSKSLENLIFLNGLKGCEKAVQYIRNQGLSDGTSLVLTYRLVQIEELILRLKQILSLLKSPESQEAVRSLCQLCKAILLAHYENTKVGQFLGRNVEILAYQITLLAERTGEHYISNSAKELKKMWWKAIKGAMVVAVLVFIKILASKIHYPPLIQALIYGSIYAIGFVIIHIIGGVLATKQPAMTASTLAAAMDGVENSDDAVDNLLEAVIRTLRTQVAALLGNYLFAFPIAIFLVFPFLVAEIPIIDHLKANMMLQDLHPVKSLSFFYAAVAGICLFLSGLISGLADNWFAFNQIADRLEMKISSQSWKKFVALLRVNFGIWSGNIVLGFMLGSMSSVGIITGIPLDIRHVTFASGAFGIGWIHQENMLPWSDFGVIALSVLAMGLINLVVSFSLSLFVAMKSRRLKFKQGRRLLWRLFKRVILAPHILFIDK